MRLWWMVRDGGLHEGGPGARQWPRQLAGVAFGVTHYPISRSWGLRRVGLGGGRWALDLWSYSIVVSWHRDQAIVA